MDKKLLDELKKDLGKEKERLEKELASFADKDPKMDDNWDARFPVVPASSADFSHSSQEDQADIREEYETEVAQEQALEERLAEVKRALARMAKGQYGLCGICSQPIAEARLKANPAAEYDIQHQPRE